ncbi:MAG: CPBP family glutamic-type intramembrane protease [Anaerolineales bacterium]
MAKQNLIATVIGLFGGDKYTQEGTEAALLESLQDAQKQVFHVDIQKEKWVFFSDHHRGGKNRANDFRLCAANYINALDHYFKEGYQLCVIGDVEELWEEYPGTVIQNNSASFAAESRFHHEERYLRLWGNHDDLWNDPNYVRWYLQQEYGKRHLSIPEAAILEVNDGKDALGSILLLHGHQGTQNEGKQIKFIKWFLHNIWRPIQIITGASANTPATDWRIREERDKIIYGWVSQQPRLMLIAGHTHRPVFASYDHRARLHAQLSAARTQLQRLPNDTQDDTLSQIERLSTDLHTLESKLSEEERVESTPLENPLPCYFNTGCCAFEDGDITGIEIAHGEIRLVRWPDDNGKPHLQGVRVWLLERFLPGAQTIEKIMFNIKPIPWKIILTYLVLSICLTTLINLVLFPSPFFDPITKATRGLVNATLQANLLNILLFSIIAFGWGKLRPSDVGLDWKKLRQGLLLTLLIWVITQAIILLINWINGDIHLDPRWSERGVTVVLGALIAQLAGNAFFEETAYRGFYLSQFYVHNQAKVERERLAWAILCMAGLFAASHLPNRIFMGYSLADFPQDFLLLFMWGLFFSAVYLVSGNLFLAMGVHALMNQPTMITEATFPAGMLVSTVGLIIVIIMGIRKRKARADRSRQTETNAQAHF